MQTPLELPSYYDHLVPAYNFGTIFDLGSNIRKTHHSTFSRLNFAEQPAGGFFSGPMLSLRVHRNLPESVNQISDGISPNKTSRERYPNLMLKDHEGTVVDGVRSGVRNPFSIDSLLGSTRVIPCGGYVSELVREKHRKNRRNKRPLGLYENYVNKPVNVIDLSTASDQEQNSKKTKLISAFNNKNNSNMNIIGCGEIPKADSTIFNLNKSASNCSAKLTTHGNNNGSDTSHSENQWSEHMLINRTEEVSSGNLKASFNKGEKSQDCTNSVPNLMKKSIKTKRVRTIFTPEQLERLEAEFERQQYMVGPERLFLASSLHLTEAQVKVWFQNRRIKWRKQHLELQQHQLAAIRSKQANMETEGEHDESENSNFGSSSDDSTEPLTSVESTVGNNHSSNKLLEQREQPMNLNYYPTFAQNYSSIHLT